MDQDIFLKREQTRQLRYAKSKFRRINSLELIPEQPSQEESSDNDNEKLSKITHNPNHKQVKRKQTMSLSDNMQKILLFWPNLVLNLVITVVRCILFIPLSIATPSFWLSALLWLFWKLIFIPINFVKWISNSDAITNNSSSLTHKRTILISCGSTVQTLHLARNFYSSGSRVIVFEFEGHFGLSRFSTAVDKFYVVPKPRPNSVDSYISALCSIVSKESVKVYIPVCATNPSVAYYDALAKPHLELLGCASFIPNIQETAVLDDCLQFYQKCATQNIPVPLYSVCQSTSDICNLYENGFISNFRNILIAVGMHGLLGRYKYILPNNRREFKLNHEINERHQWLVVREPPGDHYLTATTVKDSRIVANVTCKVERHTKNLIPITTRNSSSNTSSEIDLWLRQFFAKVRFHRKINGHISFRLVKCQVTGQFLPLSLRLGVALPYICYNRPSAQILCRTMKLSLISSEENNWRSTIELRTNPAALDKRQALFDFFDPLPYCAFYHFQLPLKSVKIYLQQRHHATKNLSPRINT